MDMTFREWLLLNEMGRARVPEGQTFQVPGLPDERGVRGPNVTVTPSHVIDMRFEDYDAGLGDFSPWQVRLPDGRWLQNLGMYNYQMSDEQGKMPLVPQQGTAREDGKQHPWYDFMEVIDHGNQQVKPPMYRRNG